MKQNNKKAVIYCRVVSEAVNNFDHSIAGQEEVCRVVAMQNGYKVIKTIADVAIGRNTKRKGFTELQKMVKSKKVDVVCVYNVDRLTRDAREGAGFFALLQKHGVELVTYTNPIQKLTETIVASMAMYDHEVRRQRVLGAIARKKSLLGSRASSTI